jgi:hypothetical protein
MVRRRTPKSAIVSALRKLTVIGTPAVTSKHARNVCSFAANILERRFVVPHENASRGVLTFTFSN